MTEPRHRYIVLGRDLDPSTPWVEGDVPDVYPVLETIDEFVADAKAARAGFDGHEVIENPEAFARGAAVILGVINPPPRVHRQRGCDCSKKGHKTPLVKAYAFKSGLWVWVRGPRIPNHARRETADLHEADTLWPVSNMAAPYPKVTRCPLCRQYRLVWLRQTGYELVRLGKPQFDGMVAI
jgi:hypothetical protein